jgi:hypothetical protein
MFFARVGPADGTARPIVPSLREAATMMDVANRTIENWT